MRRLLVISAALVIPVVILTLIFAVGGAPAAVASMAADGAEVVRAVPAGAAGQSVTPVEPDRLAGQAGPGRGCCWGERWRGDRDRHHQGPWGNQRGWGHLSRSFFGCSSQAWLDADLEGAASGQEEGEQNQNNDCQRPFFFYHQQTSPIGYMMSPV